MKPDQKELWKQLMAAWNSERIACFLHLAGEYTTQFPDDVYGWIAYADVLGNVSRFTEARDALRTAERLSDDDKRHFIYHQLGHLYSEKGNLRLAEKWYRRAVDAGGASTRNLVFLGTCLAKQGRFADAKRCHRRAIRIASDIPDEAWFNLGLILRAEGKHDKALECFDKAIELDPEYAIAKHAKTDLMQLKRIKNKASNK